jgi:xylan 1,4-beta-xylosidase
MKLTLKIKEILSLIVVLVLLVILPLALNLVTKIQLYLSQALGQPANIVIDVAVNQGPITPLWQALAQGGEEKDPFVNILPEITNLKPKYIRIDHLYDFYDVVKKENGQLIFNWTQLDAIVNQILQTGAKPLFSLSYMPPAIALEGNLLNPPVDWQDWTLIVKETIQHYSGRNQFNLKDVVYEVWNEPDLFGGWKIGGEKDYCFLYKYAVMGANQTTNINSFKIGGPSTAAPYQSWVNGFLNYIKDNHLRLDFYSWHRYGLRPEKFLEDLNQIDTWLFQNAGYSLDKYITEWGSVSENSSYHDSQVDAAHLVAIVRQLIQRVDLAFVFEIKDGPSPEGKKYWSRWGLLTNQSAGSIEKKPKYFALQLLNKMTGNRVKLEGEGTWVTGFATKENGKIKIILVNFDQEESHFEKVPITIKSLENGDYFCQETYLLGSKKSTTATVVDGQLKKEISLSANNIVVLELEKR